MTQSHWNLAPSAVTFTCGPFSILAPLQPTPHLCMCQTTSQGLQKKCSTSLFLCVCVCVCARRHVHGKCRAPALVSTCRSCILSDHLDTTQWRGSLLSKLRPAADKLGPNLLTLPKDSPAVLGLSTLTRTCTFPCKISTQLDTNSHQWCCLHPQVLADLGFPLTIPCA